MVEVVEVAEDLDGQVEQVCPHLLAIRVPNTVSFSGNLRHHHLQISRITMCCELISAGASSYSYQWCESVTPTSWKCSASEGYPNLASDM